MAPATPPPPTPRALLASARDYDAAADLAMVRKVGSLTWILVAVLAAAMLPVWPVREGPLALRLVAEAGLATLPVCLLVVRRTRRLTLPLSLATSVWSIALLALLQACSSPASRYTVLIAFPVVFTAASQAPARVAIGLLAGMLAEAAALLAHPLTATATAAATVNFIMWICLAAMALLWNAGVRWQRLELGRRQQEAETLSLQDSLTSLGNRRKLTLAMEDISASGEEAQLALFDLNGFKAYNDSFGHPAGDELLARLAASLERESRGLAEAYRMGGDEFCLLARGRGAASLDLVALGRSALRDSGHGFTISAAGGSAVLPAADCDPGEVLRLADRRMYANKHTLRGDAGRDAAGMLLAVLEERDPVLAEHCKAVAALADRVSARLAIPDPDRRHIHRAAQLHDIGKLGIPDSILQKPEALEPEELAFVQRYPVIGTRIIGSSRELAEAGELVRLSRERPDGRGYPEGLAATDIPLGALVVGACDAYDAMLREQPHRAARSSQEALDELRRGAGTQFDARVVEAVAAAVLRRGAEAPLRRPARRAPARRARPA